MIWLGSGGKLKAAFCGSNANFIFSAFQIPPACAAVASLGSTGTGLLIRAAQDDPRIS